MILSESLAGVKLRRKSGLIDAFKSADKQGESDVRSIGRLAALNEALEIGSNRTKKGKVNFKNLTKITEADLIADIARKKIAFSFINAVKQPCVIIEQNDVVHVNIAFREIVIVE